MHNMKDRNQMHMYSSIENKKVRKKPFFQARRVFDARLRIVCRTTRFHALHVAFVPDMNNLRLSLIIRYGLVSQPQHLERSIATAPCSYSVRSPYLVKRICMLPSPLRLAGLRLRCSGTPDPFNLPDPGCNLTAVLYDLSL